jgi:hypothetical protein
MTSTPERLRAVVVIGLLAFAQACGLERPPDPPPFDCAQIDRAAERFPDECGEPMDAGPDDDAGTPADDAATDAGDAG